MLPYRPFTARYSKVCTYQTSVHIALCICSMTARILWFCFPPVMSRARTQLKACMGPNEQILEPVGPEGGFARVVLTGEFGMQVLQHRQDV